MIDIFSGVGLRSPHHVDVIETKQDVGFLEIHSENFFAPGGKTQKTLKEISEFYPLSFHGVSLSLGSVEEPNKEHLQRLKQLVNCYNPMLVSEHISWSIAENVYLNDLLPLPYTKEALDVLCRNINIVQNELGRQILLENPSVYLTFNASGQMHEGEFMQEMVNQTNCGVLLDVNNIYVSCKNMQTDAFEHLHKMPIKAVQEVHLAGHSLKELSTGETLRVDTHSSAVCDDVWALYESFLNLKKVPLPTLIEWDADIPSFDVLLQESYKANALMQKMKSGENAA